MDIQNAPESEKPINRREFIRKVSVTTCAAATFPWIVRPEVLAASGTVNVLMWSDYLTPGFLQSFKDKTGIDVNHTPIGSNQDMLYTMKSTSCRVEYIWSPNNMSPRLWAQLGLLRPFYRLLITSPST